MLSLERTDEEINSQIDLASDAIEKGGERPFMTYEDGVKDALLWVTGISNSIPLDN